MNFFHLIGYVVILLSGIATALLLIASIKFIRRWRRQVTDLPMLFLLLASFLGLPIIVYEDLIFLHLYVSPLSLATDIVWVRLFLSLSAVGVVLYNLHLLSIKDYELAPIILFSTMVGVSIGGMIPSIQLGLTEGSILYYSPVTGGYLFVFGILLFNLIGFVGFSFALAQLPPHSLRKVGGLTFAAVMIFTVAPILVFIQRIFQFFEVPLNFVFLPFLISSILHMTNYLLNDATLPIQGSLIFLALFKKDGIMAKASYPKEIPEGFPFIASLKTLKSGTHPAVFGSTEMNIVVHLGEYPCLLVLRGLGAKTGRICLSRLIRSIQKEESNLERFEELVEACFFQFM